jgi:putative transposase
MPNHVRPILAPDRAEALGRALGETHRRYSPVVNARMRVTGHLFQSRFGWAVMDEEHLMAAARYVALNPVRARLAARPEDWRWSSVHAHLVARDDALTTVAPLLERCNRRFGELIDAPASNEAMAALRGGNDRPPAGIARLPPPPRRPHRPRSEATKTGSEADPR